MSKASIKEFSAISNFSNLFDYMLAHIEDVDLEADIYDWKPWIKDRKIVIFGTGSYGQQVCDLLNKNNYEVEYFCDNDQQKSGTIGYHNIPIVSLATLLEKEELLDFVFIICSYAYITIEQQLKHSGIQNYIFGINTPKHLYADHRFLSRKSSHIFVDPPIFYRYKNEIEKVYHLLADEQSKQTYLEIIKGRVFPAIFPESNKWLKQSFFYLISQGSQYFDREHFQYKSSEFFLDLGAYKGDTIINFVQFLSTHYADSLATVYAVEPDAANFNDLKQVVDNLDVHEHHLLLTGVSDKPGSLTGKDIFNCNGEEGDASVDVPITTVDELFDNKVVTFIKADIEGYEMEALRGATKTILAHKPKLAICLYHRPEDMYQIPLWLNNLVPEYKFFVKHHNSENFSETVLYATID